MSAAPDNVEELLNAIQGNKKFLQNLEEENDNDELETETAEAPKNEDEEFEEL